MDTTERDTPGTQPRSIRSLLRRLKIAADLGSSLVELALVVPVFALMLAVAAEGGRMAYFAIEVTNAARAGVAYGAQSTATSANVSAIQAAAAADAPNLAGIAALIVTPTIACQCANGTSFTTITCSTAGSTCPSPKRVIQYLQVNTSSVVGTAFKYPGIPASFTLQGLAVMRIE